MSNSHFSQFLLRKHLQRAGQRADSNPLYNNGRGVSATLQLAPPFAFRGVSMRVFPLRANHVQLQRFVDRFLYNDVETGFVMGNSIPKTTGYFRVFLPYVYLMIINYGRMSVEAANLGWIAQREIAFSIPLVWLKQNDRGKLTFYDWAYVSPFIYVDNELSMTTGREVYGWPKTMARFEPRIDTWMEDPRQCDHVATVTTMVFPEQYAGKRQQPRVLMEVTRATGPSFSAFPPDPRDLLNPLNAAARAAVGVQGMFGDALDMMQGLGITRKQPGIDPLSYLAMANRLAGTIDPYNPNIYFNTLNLKQFRDSESPVAAAYQAITNAKMVLDKFNGAALLGDNRMALGDSTGGYRIKMHCYPTQPVVDTLGLHVAARHDYGDVSVATLEPVCPFLLDVDMTYNLAEVLNWRTKHSGWCVGSKPSSCDQMENDMNSSASGQEFVPRTNFFNTQLGAATQEISGPFSFPNTTMRILPLLAEASVLQRFVDEFLNVPLRDENVTFKAWGNYVYLVAANHEQMTSHANDVGYWAERDVNFYVPVKRYDDGHYHSAMLVPVYSYANSTTAAITGSEVSGIPTMRADLVSPATSWMDDAGPQHDEQPLLRVRADVLPVLGLGQGAEKRILLEVHNGLPLAYNDDVSWRFVAGAWGGQLHDEHERKLALVKGSADALGELKAQAMRLLTGELPLNILSFKQFRDASAPIRACYQSLVVTQRCIGKVFDLREIESRIHVLIHDYPSQPLIERLGLIAKTTHYRNDRAIYVFEPLRPFWLRVAMREELGVSHFSRAGTTRWTRHEPRTPPTRQHQPPTARAVSYLERRAPQRLRDKLAAWRRRDDEPSSAPHHRPANALHITGVTVENFLELTPQLAIDSLLSNEWEHWGDPRWWQALQRLQQCVDVSMADALPNDMASRALKVVREEVEKAKVGAPRRWVAASPHIRDALNTLDELNHNLADQVHRHEALAAIRNVIRQANDTPLEVALEGDGAPQNLWTSPHGAALRRAMAAVQLLGDPSTQQIEQLSDVVAQARTENWSASQLFDALLSLLHEAVVALGLHGAEMHMAAEPPRQQLARYAQGARAAHADVRITKERLRHETQTLLVMLSKAYQKPSFCLRRDSVGTESDRTFPAHKSWEEWYIGHRDE